MNGSMPARFQELFREHYPMVVRKIARLIPDRTTAEDLAQEVFLRLYRHPPDDLSRLGPWLNRVLTHIAYDYLRQRGRLAQLQEKETLHRQVQPQTHPSNEQVAIANWERDVVKQVLGKLSERDRQALLMKEEGYSHLEIAEALHVNPKIVGTLLMRAAERFKRNANDYEVIER